MLNKFTETSDETINLSSATQHRSVFYKRGVLYLDNGYIITGMSKSMDFDSVYLETDEPIHVINQGDEGYFEFILLENNNQISTEFLCHVDEIDAHGIHLSFIENCFTPNELVFVKRSQGGFEYGWRVVSKNEKIPDAICSMMKKKQKKAPCVVCSKKNIVQRAISYKVYTIPELKKIQDIACRS